MTGQGAAPGNPRSRRAQLEAMLALQRRLNDIKSCECPEDCRGQGRDPAPEEEDNNDNDNDGRENDPNAPSNNPGGTGGDDAGDPSGGPPPGGPPPGGPPKDPLGDATGNKTGGNAGTTALGTQKTDKPPANPFSPSNTLFEGLLDVGGPFSEFRTPQPKSGNIVGPGAASAPPLFDLRPTTTANNNS